MEYTVLIEKFQLERIHPKSAIFDEKKLEWMNGQFFQLREPAYFLPLLKPLWEKAGANMDSFSEEYLLKVIGLLKERSKRLPEFVEFGLYFFVEPEHYDEKAKAKHFIPSNEALLNSLSEILSAITDFTAGEIEASYRKFAESTGRKPADLIHPTRLAISGVPFGPGLFELMAVLGQEKVIRRLAKAAETIRLI